jgi:hypothetical protein
MADTDYQSEKKERPFKFFGHEFTKADVAVMDWITADNWLAQAKETLRETDSYIAYKGDDLPKAERDKKYGFQGAMKKFIFLLEDRKRRLGAYRFQVFHKICVEEMDPSELADIEQWTTDELEAMPYEDPSQLRLVE